MEVLRNDELELKFRELCEWSVMPMIDGEDNKIRAFCLFAMEVTPDGTFVKSFLQPEVNKYVLADAMVRDKKLRKLIFDTVQAYEWKHTEP